MTDHRDNATVGAPDNAALIRELARVKAYFQMRAIATHMGIPAHKVVPPSILSSDSGVEA